MKRSIRKISRKRSIRKKSIGKRKKKSRNKNMNRNKSDGSSKLGSGVSGSVYLVNINGNKIAIKVINKNKLYRQEKFILKKN
jgi:hypothetical protein